MVLETPAVAEQREISKTIARSICKEHAPDRLAEFEKFIALTEKEGNQDGGVVEGLPYRLHRNTMGNWCGYVGVFHDHPAYGKGMDFDFNVHGGVTFSDTVHAWGHGDMWWIGFDTSHGWDLGYMSAGHVDVEYMPKMTYKDKQYTINECRKLAKQLNEMSKSSLNTNPANADHVKTSETRRNQRRKLVGNRL